MQQYNDLVSMRFMAIKSVLIAYHQTWRQATGRHNEMSSAQKKIARKEGMRTALGTA